jgi:hypothetical protein
MSSPTLRPLSQLPSEPAPLSPSALILIDCQQTDREAHTASLAALSDIFAIVVPNETKVPA